ncbi:MAG: hypothetical protein MI741_22945 [Rhodospirillales bacterium]|nr:hypothetical protein [Rhodospirillales bacterium]
MNLISSFVKKKNELKFIFLRLAWNNGNRMEDPGWDMKRPIRDVPAPALVSPNPSAHAGDNAVVGSHRDIFAAHLWKTKLSPSIRMNKQDKKMTVLSRMATETWNNYDYLSNTCLIFTKI